MINRKRCDLNVTDGQTAVSLDSNTVSSMKQDVFFHASAWLANDESRLEHNCEKWAGIPYKHYLESVYGLLTYQQRELIQAMDPQNYSELSECLCVAECNYANIGPMAFNGAEKKIEFLRSVSYGDAITSRERFAECVLNLPENERKNLIYLYPRSKMVNKMFSLYIDRERLMALRSLKRKEVGIFWVVEQKVLIHTCSYSAALRDEDILVYPLNHQDIWTKAYKSEYRVAYNYYPRGSIQFDNVRNVTRILYDINAAFQAIKLSHNYADVELIAEESYESHPWIEELEDGVFEE